MDTTQQLAHYTATQLSTQEKLIPLMLIALVIVLMYINRKKVITSVKEFTCQHKNCKKVDQTTHTVVDVDGNIEGEVNLGYMECLDCGHGELIISDRVHFKPRKTLAEYTAYKEKQGATVPDNFDVRLVNLKGVKDLDY